MRRGRLWTGVARNIVSSYQNASQELGSSYEEAHRRLAFFKHTIENGGYRQFYINKKPLQREEDVQRLFRYIWFDSSYALSPRSIMAAGQQTSKLAQAPPTKRSSR